jgi:hypothetical protein
MQEDRSELKTSTVPTKYVKNHAGAKLLAAGYTKGLLAFQVSISTIVESDRSAI